MIMLRINYSFVAQYQLCTTFLPSFSPDFRSPIVATLMATQCRAKDFCYMQYQIICPTCRCIAPWKSWSTFRSLAHDVLDEEPKPDDTEEPDIHCRHCKTLNDSHHDPYRGHYFWRCRNWSVGACDRHNCCRGNGNCECTVQCTYKVLGLSV